MAFPHMQTQQERVDFLANINARLSNDNDVLRQENQRLLEQLTKYIETGKGLVKDAKEKHWDIIALKEAVRLRDEQIALLKDANEKLTRHLQKTRTEGKQWKARVLELTNRGDHLQRRLTVSPMDGGTAHSSSSGHNVAYLHSPHYVPPPLPTLTTPAPWPAVGDVVEVKNPYKAVPQHYYEVLAIGSVKNVRYIWPSGGGSPLKPNQYLVRAVNSLSKKDNELVDGEDWDLLYIGAEQEKYSKFHNYIAREKPLGE